ncbi:hypothetical protein CONPUDRAFT_134543 [Coniophora puteana RWD-64-598 SS2]|uniref:Uncharacterized protein n=1 Tax=Coniophora puteana (strain RWD-64-598) TaxID=741705 RepID=A0A5M3N7B7_CONPW|nr:uncharacterized protein CONPUDRAFT_134543 [Coniophora puteana RWD-64-598 SS2]EIW87339.1 hypothetical protein CONPUDRAFT_134543 [Coniophora puteana RWD-64-598 SS2]
MSALTKDHGLGGGDVHRAFKYGMLVADLEWALIWQPEPDARLERRVVRSMTAGGQVDSTPWPSWAWAGWHGAVRYANDDQYVEIHDAMYRAYLGPSVVDAWFIVEDGGLVRLDVYRSQSEIDEDGHSGEGEGPEQEPAYTAPTWGSSWKLPQGVKPGTLVFRTTVTCLHVENVQDGVDIEGEHHALFSIILRGDDHSRLIVGRAILPRSHPSGVALDFAVVSRRKEPCSQRWVSDIGAEQKAGRLLDVVAMKPGKDIVRERVGMGVVLTGAWHKARAVDRVVLLG